MTLNKEALEKAAQALTNSGERTDVWSGMRESSKGYFTEQARAAITAYLTSLPSHGELVRELESASVAVFLGAPEEVARDLSRILRAAATALRMQEGWVLVPREPTTGMIDAALAEDEMWSINIIPRLKRAYKAMLSAAPVGSPTPGGNGHG